jgi:hypothetical protein
MQLVDLAMEDVEAYNRMLVAAEYSASLVSKRLQFVHSIVKRAGRPEHDSQILGWNWDSRDVLHGKRADKRKLPSLSQLKSILRTCSAREKAMVWLAIGCGFGQRDLAAIKVGQLDRKRYDLRRGKTGIDRYGETPPMVWNAVNKPEGLTGSRRQRKCPFSLSPAASFRAFNVTTETTLLAYEMRASKGAVRGALSCDR